MDPLFPLAALAIGGAVGMALAGFRDPKANEHDLSDYREPALLTFADLRAAQGVSGRVDPASLRLPGLTDDERRNWLCDDDILPPAPPGMNAGSPLYAGMFAEQVVAEQLRERWGTTSPAAIADRMLRELRDEAWAKTVAQDLKSRAKLAAVTAR